MRALVAFDKFKDALTARQACEAAATALRAKHPDWQLDLCPLTDGGEGFCATLCQDVETRIEQVTARGPRGGATQASVGFVSAWALEIAVRRRLSLPGYANLAVLDLASASGLALLPPAQRDPWHTTTYGTGELLQYAALQCADAILLGVGGSATNDLGLGALAALGCKFFDAADVPIATPTPATWEQIHRIDCADSAKLPPIFIACDVTNPLLGPRGAAATFGPQKGLCADDLPRLEAQAARLAALLCKACGQRLSLAEAPGTGAAGGFPFGLMAAGGPMGPLKSDVILVPGFDLVCDWLSVPSRIAAADLVLTGEGRFDATSLAGKGPGSLVTEARRQGKQVRVFAGSIESTTDTDIHPITPAGLPLAEALPRTAELLAAAVARVL